MPPPLCPSCQTVLLPSEIEAGWCDSCGKKLPTVLRDSLGTASKRHESQPPKAADTRSRLMRFIDALPVWLVLILGLGGVGWGVEEYRVALGTSAEAAEVDLAALEKGGNPSQNHIRIGPHIRIYQALIYSSREEGEGVPDPRVDFAIYPVVSVGNPFMKKFRAMLAAEGMEKLEHMIIPPIDDLRVLVLTNKFRKKSEIPSADAPGDHITGLVVNSIRDLRKDEVDLLRQKHPEIDFSKVLVLEEDRKPKASLIAILIASGGGILLFLATIGFFRRIFIRVAGRDGVDRRE